MRILNQHIIAHLLSLSEVIEAVEAAMMAYEKNEAIVPQRMHVNQGKDTLLCMPAWGPDYFATKLVSVIPGNTERNMPVINGALLLNDGKTGMPLALIDAAQLTALRTGALGAVGIKYLTPQNETSIGLMGCGVQGIHQAVFACAVRKLSTIHYLHRSEESAARLTSFVHSYFPTVSVKAAHSTEELLNNTNIIVAATTSAQPVLPDDESMLRGKHFVSIGSYNPSMQELPDAVYKLASELFIDSEFARVEVGDCLNPVSKGYLKAENIFTIGKLVSGERVADLSSTTVYKSAGMALYDLFVAQALYLKAENKNVGIRVAF